MTRAPLPITRTLDGLEPPTLYDLACLWDCIEESEADDEIDFEARAAHARVFGALIVAGYLPQPLTPDSAA